jgi:hypothetical protein
LGLSHIENVKELRLDLERKELIVDKAVGLRDMKS